jgi:hexulose-6-phosphate isomerase
MTNMIQRIGFMQGRLLPLVGDRIQAFPGELWADEFVIAKDINIRNIEWTIDTLTFDSNPLIQEAAHKTIRKLALENYLKIPSVTCDYFMENPHWDSNGIDIERDVSRIIEAMPQVGANILVIPLVDNSSISKNQNMDLKFFKNLESKLIQNNVCIAFELDLEPKLAGDFIESFNPRHFGINYDIGNSASLGFSPIIEITSYGTRILNIHVKDRLIGGHTVPLGRGNADFKTVVKNLHKIKYSGNFIMQTARARDGEHKAELKRNIDFFERVLIEH